MLLRDYQHEALDALALAYRRGVHRAIISLPTGCGKTTLFPCLPTTMRSGRDDVMLVLAHRSELIDQAAARIKADLSGARVGREKAHERAHPKCNVVVASVQTLHSVRLHELLYRFDGRIAICVVDECHHAVSPAYTRVLDAIAQARPDALIVGFTATTPRADGLALGRIFEEIVYHRDLPWAIEQGWLVPPRCHRLAGHADLGNVGNAQGDFAPAALTAAINTGARNTIIVRAYQHHLAGKKTMVFCTAVEHAQRLCAAFADAGIAAQWGSGACAPERRRAVLRAFAAGKVSVLVNCLLWVEGFDDPTVEAIINARPTRSRTLYCQLLGRGTRPHPTIASRLGEIPTASGRRETIAGSPKPELTVIDIIDDHARDLVTLPSILGRVPRPTAQRVPSPRGPSAHIPLDAETLGIELEEVQRIGTGTQRSHRKVLHWRDGHGGGYELVLPDRWLVSDPAFERAFLKALDGVQDHGGRPAWHHAAAAIGLPLEQVELVRERLTIIARADGFRITLHRNASTRILGDVVTMLEAFSRAERWLSNNRPEAREALAASAGWRHKTPTPAQLSLLKDLGSLTTPADRGEAANTIAELLSQRRRPA